MYTTADRLFSTILDKRLNSPTAAAAEDPPFFFPGDWKRFIDSATNGGEKQYPDRHLYGCVCVCVVYMCCCYIIYDFLLLLLLLLPNCVRINLWAKVSYKSKWRECLFHCLLLFRVKNQWGERNEWGAHAIHTYKWRRRVSNTYILSSPAPPPPVISMYIYIYKYK